jgi:YfiR/HmsC-like
MRRGATTTFAARRGVLKLLGRSAALALVGRCARGGEVYPENVVKAAFLYRFTGYVKWPPPAAAIFTIATLGAGPIAEELRRIIARRTIDGTPARIQPIESIQDLGDAQMLYIGAGSLGALQEEIAQIADRPVLVVTDSPNGLDAGSTLNFLLLDRRVRFEVSLVAADRARLRVSAELLSVAARVERDPRRTGASLLPLGCARVGCPGRFG